MLRHALTAATSLVCGLLCSGADAARSPLSLTASDGTGLELRTLRARAVIQGPLAYTQLHLTFNNPLPKVIEGRFSITMPEGAAISRFAMRIDGSWREAEVVERQRAREVYESFLHERVDPALLEREAGNRFRARVFPIPARGTKELIVSYSQELASRPYQLPLLGLPRIGRIEVTVQVGQAIVSRLFEERYLPNHDLDVPRAAASVDGLTHGGLSVVRVRPRVPDERTAAPLDSLLVLFDTSASRAPVFEAQIDTLARLIAALVSEHGAELALRVVCFDQTVEPIFDGRAQDFGAPQLERIRGRGALGASDLGLALRAVRGTSRHRRVLLFTDGIATAGAVHPRDLRRAIARLRDEGVERLDLMLTGAARDAPAARQLVTDNGLAHDGVVLDGDLPELILTRRLKRQVLSGITVRVPGASWTWPTRLDGLQPGDEALIYTADPLAVSSRAPGLEVQLVGAGLPRQTHRIELRPAGADGALLRRAWARARIQWLSTVPRFSSAVAGQIVELSTRHRVLSDLTAMLVLETEDDYERFGLTRRGLSDIVVLDPFGLRSVQRPAHLPRIHRRRAWRPTAPPEVRAARSRLEGLARSWNPDGGHPALAIRARRARAPQVRVGRCEIRGSLDKEILRLTIRRQFNRIRHCYAKELQSSRDLAGRLTVHVVIEEGVVIRARVVSSTLYNRAVESCVARTFFDLRFPRPSGGGTIEISYPLVFRSEANPPAQVTRPRAITSDAQLPPVPDPADPVPDDVVFARRRPTTTTQAPTAHTGRMLTIQTYLARGRLGSALREARRWRQARPGDLLPLVALGDTLRAAGALSLAARAYGSIIDLYPTRADRRRLAGGLLEVVGQHRLAVETYTRAANLRPDHPGGHRLLAMAQLRRGRYRQAFSALTAGLERRYPEDRFEGVKQVLREDLALVAAAWIARQPDARAEVLARLAPFKLAPATRPSLRLVLTWETDASDMDLELQDSGGELVEGLRNNNVTTGYGPERIVLRNARRPLWLRVRGVNLGSTGYGQGTVQIVRHDGKGRLTLEQRPFLVMHNGTAVDLGSL